MKWIFLILLSCQTLVDRGPISRSSMKKYLTAACLSGAGDGEVKIGSDSFSFDYESAFRNDAWILAVEVPLRGEEILQIQKAGKGFLYQGGFYDQLVAGYEQLMRKKSFYKREYLQKFLGFMGRTLFILKSFSEKKEKWAKSYFDQRCGSAPVEKCTFEYKGRQFQVTSNSLRVSKRLENFDLVWSFKGYSDDLNGHYEMSELMLRSGSRDVMGVNFSHDRCQSATTLL